MAKIVKRATDKEKEYRKHLVEQKLLKKERMRYDALRKAEGQFHNHDIANHQDKQKLANFFLNDHHFKLGLKKEQPEEELEETYKRIAYQKMYLKMYFKPYRKETINVTKKLKFMKNFYKSVIPIEKKTFKLKHFDTVGSI